MGNVNLEHSISWAKIYRAYIDGDLKLMEKKIREHVRFLIETAIEGAALDKTEEHERIYLRVIWAGKEKAKAELDNLNQQIKKVISA